MKVLLVLFIPLWCLASDFATEVQNAEKDYSIDRFVTICQNLEKWTAEHPEDLEAKYWLARAYLGQCNIERFFRRELPETKGKNITRPGTAKIAQQGIELINTIAKQKPKWAEIFRVRGELYSHTIVGFLTGMSNGPKALKDVEASMALDPQNFYVHIAKAKMFYYNPPISGGDVDKGIKTCKKAIKLGAKDKAYTLLGRCYIKKGRPQRSVLYLRKALKLNPQNTEAQYFLDKALQSN